MLKLVSVDAYKIAAGNPLKSEVANSVFRVLHGFYGNLFLSKFATGEVRPDGTDGGVASARQIWAYGLRDFDAATIKTALGRTMESHPEYPPTLPQFVSLCKASAPRAVYRPEVPEIGMSQELRSARAAAAREIAGRASKLTHGDKHKPTGLDLLKQAIADAAATAGGDEAAELSRLDRMFAKQEVVA